MLQPDEIQQQLMTIFQAELDEHIGTLNKGLLALEQDPVADERAIMLAGVFRAAHSLKGAARAVGLRDIEVVAHRLEDALSVIRQSDCPLMPQHIDTLLMAVDSVKGIMSAHLRGEALPPDNLNALFDQLQIVMRDMTGPAGHVPAASPADTQAPAPLQPANIQPPAGNGTAVPSPASQPPIASQAQLPNPGAAPPARAASIDDTIRVSTAKLDTLMDNLGELLVARMRMGQLIEQVRSLQQHATTWQKDWRKARSHYNSLHHETDSRTDSSHLADSLAGNESELKVLNAELSLLLRRIGSDHNHLELVTSDLQDSIRKMRMLPIATLFHMFPRMVRDLAHERGKEVILQTEGEDTEVDRQALELLRDPLTHVVRNAIDHGIEPPDERLANGKARHGALRLCAEQRGDRLVLEVSDDGRGIDLKAVRQAAVERGMLEPQEAASLDEPETLDLIFRSGLSTAREVSQISGRGVGMDVVRQNVEQLRGLIQVQTQTGKGTTFILTLPLTLATSNVLLMLVAGQTVGLPLMNVDRILRIDANQAGTIEGRPALYTDGRLLPLIDLAHLLELPNINRPAAPGEKIPVAIVAMADKRIAVRVEGFLSTQEVVIKPLGRQIRRVRNLAGAAILGNGQVVLILNPADLIKTSHVRSMPAAITLGAPEAARHRVLVVDDSITTRTLVKHILANASYDVTTAADGREAWELIRANESRLPQAVISDINMPNMDGFALTEAIKSDARYSHLPVVLVTSMDSPQDKVRGLEAGADAYIMKGSFDQRELLETIERLIG